MSRVNALLHGSPEDVISVLESMAGEEMSSHECYLRMALINAMQKIERLEEMQRKEGKHP